MTRRTKSCGSIQETINFKLEHDSLLKSIRIGDIAGVVSTSLQGRLQTKLMLPSSKWMHFFPIGEYIPLEDDFVIYESIPSHGVATGRLSWYFKDKVAIFRPNTDISDVGQKAIWQTTKFGRSGYDFRAIIYVIEVTLYRCFENFINSRGFHVRYTNFKAQPDNKSVLCTELVKEAYEGLYPIFDDKYLPLPCNFIQSVFEGRIKTVGEW